MGIRHLSRPAISRMAQLAVMPAGALAVHQLRYWLAFGGHAGVVLRAQGHAYLHSVAPWIILVLALSVGVFLRALGAALGGRSSVPGLMTSFISLWLLCGLALVGIYVSQEFLEGFLIAGHPAGLIGVFGYGGWWSIPAALAVGLVMAAVFHGATWVIHEVGARHRPRPSSRPRPLSFVRVRREVFVLRPALMGDSWSGRGPPG